MFIGKSQSVILFRIASMFAIIFLAVACGGGQEDPNLVEQYYSAIENGDADMAASFFAEDAVVTVPSGKVFTGIDAIKSEFIPYDLQYMDRVDFLSDFKESNGKLSWTQDWHGNEGDTFSFKCEVTVENGKIVEWVLQ